MYQPEAVIGTTSLWLEDDQISEIKGAEDTSVSNGPPFDGAIKPVNSGYLLNGHWGFSRMSARDLDVWARLKDRSGWRLALLSLRMLSLLITGRWRG